jgi:hypothetical protein
MVGMHEVQQRLREDCAVNQTEHRRREPRRRELPELKGFHRHFSLCRSGQSENAPGNGARFAS